MSLDFLLFAPCLICGYRLTGMQFASGCRVNKNSIVIKQSLVAGPMGHGDGRCPECRTNPPRWDRVQRRVLTPESQVKVDAVRVRRGWAVPA